eukprot:4046219-Amphidinium_carterae.1
MPPFHTNSSTSITSCPYIRWFKKLSILHLGHVDSAAKQITCAISNTHWSALGAMLRLLPLVLHVHAKKKQCFES